MIHDHVSEYEKDAYYWCGYCNDFTDQKINRRRNYTCSVCRKTNFLQRAFYAKELETLERDTRGLTRRK